MRSRRLLTVAALSLTAVIALGASGCDRSPRAGTPTPPAAAAGTDDLAGAGPNPDGGSAAGTGACELAQSGADVRVRVTGADAGAGGTFCADLARSLSGGGSFWTANPPSIDTASHQVVCAMTDKEHAATVLDTGSAFIGRDVCASLLQAGWQEDTAAEAAHAQARASASTAATEAQKAQQAQADEDVQLTRDSDAVDTALTHVNGWPATLTEDLGKVDHALKDVKTALAQTRTDAADGQGEDCYNVQTVAYDAEQNVGYEVTQGVGYAATQDVGADVISARADIAALDQSVAELTAHRGAQAPAGVDAAKSTLRRAIAVAVTHTNEVIDKANAHAATAYAIAAKLATGACSDDGPGDREPLAHIR